MRKPWVTLCLPSHRPLAAGRSSIEAFIGFAENRGYRIVISDNSGDQEKAAAFAGTCQNLVYLADCPQSGAANMLNALLHAETEFVLACGDDDRILVVEGQDAFDFSALPPDHIGVKPQIEIFSNANGLLRRNEFPILSDDPASRMLDYANSVRGDNSSYYSFVRRRQFTALCQLFVKHHPTKAANTDWPMMLSLVAAGKYAIDSATQYRYNIGKWEHAAGIDAAVLAIITEAGLPAQAVRYASLFHFLDAYVYVNRRHLPMTPDEKRKASQTAAIIYLRDLLRKAYRNPTDYTLCRPFLAPLIAAMSTGRLDMDRIFSMACNVAEALKPGLKAGYEAFLEASLTWPESVIEGN